MAEEVEEEVVGVKRRRGEELGDFEEEEEVVDVKKRRKDEELEENPLAKKGRLDEETDDVDNLPASLLSLSDDVILGVLRWANFNNPHTHSCCSDYFYFANLWRKRSQQIGVDLHCQRHSQHQDQQQKLFVNEFCSPPKKDLEK